MQRVCRGIKVERPNWDGASKHGVSARARRDVGRSGPTLMPDNTFEVRCAFVGSLHGYAAELVTREIAGLLKMPCLHETLDSGWVAERRYGLERAASGDFLRRMRYASTLPLPKLPSPRRLERVPLVALLSRALATF